MPYFDGLTISDMAELINYVDQSFLNGLLKANLCGEIIFGLGLV